VNKNAKIASTGEAAVILTAEEYEKLLNRLEDAYDRALIDTAWEESQGAPLMPMEILQRELAGELSPLAAWRKSAGMTQRQLAEKSGVLPRTISEFENGRIDPRLSTLQALAKAIGVDIQDIVPDEPKE